MLLILIFNPLKADLNPICHLLALLGAPYIFHVSGLRVNVEFEAFFNCDCSIDISASRRKFNNVLM